MTTDQLIYGVAMLLAGLLVWRFSVQYDEFLEKNRDRTGLSWTGKSRPGGNLSASTLEPPGTSPSERSAGGASP